MHVRLGHSLGIRASTLRPSPLRNLVYAQLAAKISPHFHDTHICYVVFRFDGLFTHNSENVMPSDIQSVDKRISGYASPRFHGALKIVSKH